LELGSDFGENDKDQVERLKVVVGAGNQIRLLAEVVRP
jgi:hypothetical protein